MITGLHAILFSPDADRVRQFLGEVLGFDSVDAGGGWLIFGPLPPAELAVHPSEDGPRHELYLMCDDVERAVAELATRGVETGPISDERWGRLTAIMLPGGGELGLYEPRHPSPIT
jgi:catechol 2,3-dioxygenase-like lactoylglutathione lyase family enzyme